MTNRNLGLWVRLYRVLSRLARRRLICVAALFVFTIVFRLALSHVLSHPEPSIHDEFAYLLGADLLAHGRVAAPPHPHWKFFEAFHVISRPVYAPKYPPGQAAFLSIGQMLFHDPFYGVLISVALFAAAACWMLQAYVKPVWSLMGGICTALYFGAGNYWTESYWGGAVAGIGAALLMGAFGRLKSKGEPNSGITFGIGALILATSRPYEGSVLIVILCVALAASFWTRRRTQPRTAFATFASLTVALGIVLAYNHSVTGQALKMPYTVHMEQYGGAPTLWFMPNVTPKSFENPAIRALTEEYEIPTYKTVSSSSVVSNVQQSMITIVAMLIPGGGVWWFLPLIFLPLFRGDSNIRLFAFSAASSLALLIGETYMSLHYMAPVLVVVTLLVWLVIDRLWKLRRTRRADRIVLVSLLACGLFAGPVWRTANAMAGRPTFLYRSDGFGFKRARIVREILKHPGNHVVLVHYTPQQNILHTWVANGAEIDKARLIWAHDRGAENEALQGYFKDRTFWSLEENGEQVTLVPYNSKLVSHGVDRMISMQ